MARHLIIGDGTTRSTANPVEDGAVTIQKMSSSGPTDLVLGDTIIDAPMIRIVGGGKDGKNIVTPWIYGRDVINYSGIGYVGPTAHTGTVVASGSNSSSAGTVVVKFVKTSGPRTEFFSFATEIASGQNNSTSGTDIHDAFEALDNIPDWLNPLAGDSSGTVTFSGALRGDVAQSGNTWDYEPVVFNVILESSDVGTQVFTANSGVADASPGYGDGFAVRAFEESLQGTSHGFYMRGHLPQQPTLESVTSSNYDMYSIVATKDGSSASQINGVDNLIEINIALVEGDADSLIVENKLNAYFAGEFPAVIL